VTEEELAQLLTDLEGLLGELGLDFIVVQERVLAAEGVSQSAGELARKEGETVRRLEPREAQVSSVPRPEWERGRETRSARTAHFKNSDVVVTPLDPRARLAILLDLIEVATAGTLAMERDVREEFEEYRRSGRDDTAVPREEVATVLFTDPPEAELRGQVLPPWRLATVGVLAESMSRARTVVELLDGLREHAGLSRGDWLAPYGGDAADDAWKLTRGSHDKLG
jgi:hypothetical protein